MTSVGHCDRTIPRDLQVTLDQLRPPFAYAISDPKPIGSGKDKVYAAIRDDTNQKIAVKKTIFTLDRVPWEQVLSAIEEGVKRYVAVSRLEHPNIVRHFGLTLEQPSSDELVLSLFMEYCSGRTLTKYTTELTFLVEHQIKRIARQIISGLEYLFDRGICHLDLKGTNIIQAEDGTFKICDFGEIVQLESPSRTQTNEVRTNVGTPCYMAPEMVNDDHAKPGRASDMYSFGCVLIEMMTGKEPQFKSPETGAYLRDGQQIKMFVGHGGCPEVPREPAELVKLVHRCLLPDPELRPTAHYVAGLLSDEPTSPRIENGKLICPPAFPHSGPVKPDSALSPEAITDTPTNELAVGIDLGASFCCVAVHRNDRLETILNSYRYRTTPSYVTFDEESDPQVGEASRDSSAINPNNAIFGIKRIMGKTYAEAEIQRYKWPFAVINQDGHPYVKVNVKGKEITHSPVEISALILNHLRETATLPPGTVITKAVITVPSSFSEAQREATKQAGQKAGLEVIGLVNDSTAAALAYNFRVMSQAETYLMFDFGGGSLDVAVVKVENGTDLTELASLSDTSMGGEDINELFLKRFVDEFNKDTPGVDLRSDPSSVARLRLRLEQVKRSLSTADRPGHMGVSGLPGDKSLNLKIKHDELDDMCGEIFKKIMKPVEDVLRAAGLDATKINGVVMVGGSSRILRVKQILADHFPGAVIHDGEDDDDLMAKGAAIYANCLLAGASGFAIGQPGANVSAFGLSVKLAGSQLYTLIPQGTPLPASSTQMCTTSDDRQNTVRMALYKAMQAVCKEGESSCLGHLTLSGVAPATAKQPRIQVVFSWNADGTLSVRAMDCKSRKAVKCSLHADPQRRSEPKQVRAPKRTRGVKKAADNCRKWPGTACAVYK